MGIEWFYFHVLQSNTSITFSLNLAFERDKRVLKLRKIIKSKCLEKINIKMYAVEIYNFFWNHEFFIWSLINKIILFITLKVYFIKTPYYKSLAKLSLSKATYIPYIKNIYNCHIFDEIIVQYVYFHHFRYMNIVHIKRTVKICMGQLKHA
jgi:hypothetical protein